MKNKIIVLSIFFVCIVCIFLFGVTEKTKKENEEMYTIITDMKWKTMQNDGGSHTSLYYEIDIKNKEVRRIMETYRANMGGQSEINKRIEYSKKIDDELIKETKDILDKYIKQDDNKPEKSFDFYVIKRNNEEKNIYNYETIDKLNALISKYDRLS